MAEYLDLEAAEDGQCDSGDDEEGLTLSELDLMSGNFIDDSAQVSTSYPNPYLTDADDENDDDDDGDDCPIPPSGVLKRSNREMEKDNHSSSPPQKKSGNACRYWCFTLFNHDDDDEQCLSDLYPSEIEYLCYGHEVCPETGRKHLQGFLKVPGRGCRFNQMKALMPDGCHIEKCKGSPQQNFEYCTKSDEHFVEFGDKPWGGGVKEQKIQTVIRQIMDGCSVQSIIDSPLCHVFVVNRDKILKVVEDLKNEKRVKKMVSHRSSVLSLRDWQSEIVRQFNEEDTDRKIFWVYDVRGGVGKTHLCRELKMQNPDGVVVFQNGSSRDISYIYNGEKLVLFDFSRQEQRCINYDIIEKLKNGFVTSTKYQGHSKMFKIPTICCFSNNPPDVHALSVDRWCIYCVDSRRSLLKMDPESLMM